MAEDVVKEKQKRTKKVLAEEPVEEISTAPFIDENNLKKGLGLFLLFLSLFLFISFFSYLFTWKNDQDKIFNFSWKIIFSKEAIVENSMGRMGAYFAHIFIYNLFGVAAFIVPCLLLELILFLMKKYLSSPKYLSILFYG